MPMRDELAMPTTRSTVSAFAESDAWAVISFCLIGLTMAIYFAVSSQPLDQMSVLITQANLW
jgi:hypothetical protein